MIAIISAMQEEIEALLNKLQTGTLMFISCADVINCPNFKWKRTINCHTELKYVEHFQPYSEKVKKTITFGV